MRAPTNRPRCPFYGFHWPENTRSLTDSGDNQCGLDFERHGGCIMEAEGRAPDYETCRVPAPIRPLLEASKKIVVLYPAECRPEGVRLDEWTQQVMARARRAG